MTEEIKIIVKSNFPGPTGNAEYLRSLWAKHVKFLDDHWKGRVYALVDESISDDVAEAMDFNGALIEFTEDREGGKVYIFSEGYWANGFEG